MNSNKIAGTIVEIGETNFKPEVMGSKQPLMVVFWASSSWPCHIRRLVFDEVTAACAETETVVKSNADIRVGSKKTLIQANGGF